jgi:hypothetical protein
MCRVQNYIIYEEYRAIIPALAADVRFYGVSSSRGLLSFGKSYMCSFQKGSGWQARLNEGIFVLSNKKTLKK